MSSEAFDSPCCLVTTINDCLSCDKIYIYIFTKIHMKVIPVKNE